MASPAEMAELIQAADSGDVSIMETLLSGGGVDINGADSNGLTPLHHAVINGRFKAVILLVENGAELNRCDRGGWSPLHSAVYATQESIGKYLIFRGCDTQLRTTGGLLAEHLADDEKPKKKNKSCKTTERNWVVNLIGEYNDWKCGKLAVGKPREPQEIAEQVKGEVETQVGNKSLPVYDEDQRASVSGSYGTVGECKDGGSEYEDAGGAGGELEARVKNKMFRKIYDDWVEEGGKWKSKLDEAAGHGDMRKLETLISKGVSLLNTDALHAAVNCNQLGTVKYLLKKGADINGRLSEGGWTALHLAAATNRKEIAEYLIKSGCDTTLIDSGGKLARDLVIESESVNPKKKNRRGHKETNWIVNLVAEHAGQGKKKLK